MASIVFTVPNNGDVNDILNELSVLIKAKLQTPKKARRQVQEESELSSAEETESESEVGKIRRKRLRSNRLNKVNGVCCISRCTQLAGRNGKCTKHKNKKLCVALT